MSQTYDVNDPTKQKLINLNYQINKFIVKITKSKCIGQVADDGLWSNLYDYVEIH